jgi:hypothetical protein
MLLGTQSDYLSINAFGFDLGTGPTDLTSSNGDHF